MSATCELEAPAAQTLLFSQLGLRINQKREPMLYSKGNAEKQHFSVLATSSKKGQWSQWSVPVDDLQASLDELRGDVNTYASQAVFFAEDTREACYVEHIQVVFVDIDYQKIPDLADLSPAQAARLVLARAKVLGLPEPTVILDSGQGLHFKWPLRAPVVSHQFEAWGVVQRLLCDAFAELGADHGAKDLARVLRLPGTKNLKNGRVAALLRASDELHDFVTIAQAAFKISPPKLAPVERQEPRADLVESDPDLADGTDLFELLEPGVKRVFNRYSLHRARIRDIVTLCQKRGWTKAVPRTNRNNVLFAIAVSLSWLEPAKTVSSEVHRIARKLTPDFRAAEVNGMATSVIKRAKAAEEGKKILWKGEQRDPRYLLTNDWLIDLLKITAKEQRVMLTIIGPAERRARAAERKAAARRATGAALRSDYLADASAKRQAALTARAEGKSWAEAALIAGYKNARSARMSA